ncbi:hypothetical protein [Nocardia australiensis]|uniref:hypothetical protein n=1 Tax=Nocardia australiensis TaxID=2887191 RepID=UPI001D15A908|nr:hypothetical protein [Nocardia australiensis]
MSDIVLQLVFGAACIALGFCAGLSLSWREYRRGKKAITLPAMPRTDRQQAYWLLLVALLAVVSTAFAAMQSAKQEACNTEFRTTLITRSAITAENQTHLDDMIAAIADASANPQPDSRERMEQAIIDYQNWVVEAQRQRAENPLTDPKCGG